MIRTELNSIEHGIWLVGLLVSFTLNIITEYSLWYINESEKKNMKVFICVINIKYHPIRKKKYSRLQSDYIFRYKKKH